MPSKYKRKSLALPQDAIFLGLKSSIYENSFYKLQHFIGLLKERDAKNGSCTLAWDDGNILLCKALERQLNHYVDLLLDYGVKVNRSNNRPYHSPLHLALQHNDLEMIEKLLIKGADINIKNSGGQSALYVAVWNNNEKIVEMMLKYNKRPNFKTQGRLDIMDCLVAKGNEKIFNLLVSCGARANLKYLDSNNLFHVAVEKGNRFTVEKFIDEGKYDIMDPKSKQVLTVAVKNFKEHPSDNRYQAIVKKLLVDAKFPHEPEVIKDAEFICEIVSRGLCTIVDNLLKIGADPNIVDSRGCPLLIIACRYSKSDIVKRLLEEKAVNINAKNRNGKTVLNIAIDNLQHSQEFYEEQSLDNVQTDHPDQWFEIIKALIDRGVDVNTQDSLMMTPLHHVTNITKKIGDTASFHYVEELIKLLINAGADLNACDTNGYNPLQYAMIQAQEKITELLISHTKIDKNYVNYQKQTYLHLSAMMKSSKVLKILLEREQFTNLDVKDVNGNTPLILAAEKNRAESINTLLKCGVNVNACNNELITSLHYATQNTYFHEEIVEKLLKHNANPNCIDKRGRTPLLIAAMRNNDDTVKFLLKHGANINLRSVISGKMVLHHLAECQQNVSFNVLKYGADINCLTGDKKTALDCLMDSMMAYYNNTSGNFTSLFKYQRYAEPKFGENAYILIKYILQLHAINYFVCQENLLSIDAFEDKYGWVTVGSGSKQENVKIEEIRKMCEKEVELMRQYTFKNTNVNVYQILTKCPHRLAKYVLKNDNVINELQSSDFVERFPIYRDMLSLRIEECLTRKTMLDQDDYSFHNIFPFLPFVCIEEILNYLDNRDLRALISVCQLTIVYQDSVCNTSIQDKAESSNVAKKQKIRDM